MEANTGQMIDSLEVVIAADDVKYLAAVLRGEFDADDVDLTDIHGIEIGLQPALFELSMPASIIGGLRSDPPTKKHTRDSWHRNHRPRDERICTGQVPAYATKFSGVVD